MLSFYLSALESAADKEDFRALYRRYHGVMERTALAILQDTLWDEVKRFDYPHKYVVDLSRKLWNIQQELLRSSQQ